MALSTPQQPSSGNTNANAIGSKYASNYGHLSSTSFNRILAGRKKKKKKK